MVVLGLDPGTLFMGYAVIDGGPIILESGVLKLSKNDHMTDRLGEIFHFFNKLILRYSVKIIALETPFLGKNPSVYLKLGYVRGIVYVLSHNNRALVCEYAPSVIKKSITGVGSASKEDVAFALCKIFPSLRDALKVGVRTDITDAIAIGVTGLWKQ